MKRSCLALLVAACSAPIDVPDAGPALRYPLVPNGGGPVLSHSALVAVTFDGDPNAPSHVDFTAWLVSGGWLEARTAEYGVVSLTAGTAVSLPSTLPALATDANVQALLTGRPSTALYVVYLPPGVVLTDRFGNRTCESNPGTGYHEHIDASGTAYVVVPACAARFSAVLDLQGSMHLDAARLAVDALTNPSPRNTPAFALTDTTSPWTSLGAEVGDFCWSRFVSPDGHTLQRVWSNAAVRDGREPCQPAGSGEPFGLTLSPATLQPMAIGAERRFTVTAWGTPSQLDVRPWFGDFTMVATLERTALEPGQATGLTVTVPFPVQAGTIGAVLLRAISGDERVQWPVSFVIE